MFSWAVRSAEQRAGANPHRPPPAVPTPRLSAQDTALHLLVAGEPDPYVALLPRERDGAVDFVITHASAAALTLLHLRPDDLGSATMAAVVPTPVSRRLPATCARVWRTGEPVTVPDVLWTSVPQRGPRWVDLRLRRLAGHVCVLVLDVTARHAQQEEFAAAEARFRALAENAADVVFRTRGRNRLTWVSPGVSQALGYGPWEVVGRELTDLIHPEDIAGGQLPERFEARVRHADGHWVWLSIVTRSEYDDDGREVGRVGSAHDVSRDKRDAAALRTAQAQLRVEKNRLRAILDAALDPHVVLSAVQDATGRVFDLRFEDCNSAAENYLGRPRSELLGVTVSALYGPVTAATAVDWARRVLATGTPLVLRDRALYSEVAQCVRRADVSMVRLDDGVSFTWRDLGAQQVTRR